MAGETVVTEPFFMVQTCGDEKPGHGSVWFTTLDDVPLWLARQRYNVLKQSTGLHVRIVRCHVLPEIGQ